MNKVHRKPLPKMPAELRDAIRAAIDEVDRVAADMLSVATSKDPDDPFGNAPDFDTIDTMPGGLRRDWHLLAFYFEQLEQSAPRYPLQITGRIGLMCEQARDSIYEARGYCLTLARLDLTRIDYAQLRWLAILTLEAVGIVRHAALDIRRARDRVALLYAVSCQNAGVAKYKTHDKSTDWLPF